jgi:transcriptional regulator with XRE-family HTH domain
MARRRVGLAQVELAKRSGMPQPAISRIERGTVSPSVDTLERLLRACDQELESVAVATDRDLDWDQVDDHLDMSPAARAQYAAAAGRSMLQFHAAARRRGGEGEDPPFDPPTVFGHFAARGVEFIVIGGFAAALRGSPMITEDLDICLADSEANRWRVSDALADLGARVRDELTPSVVIEEALRVGDRCSFETRAGTVDVIAKPRATNGYVDLVAGADRLDTGDGFVLVPSLDDLVRMKVDGFRPQDWIALHYLRAVRKRQAVEFR